MVLGYARQLSTYSRQAAKLPGAILTAITNPPYGWGEYVNQVHTWEVESYPVRRGSINIDVECLLHLQPDRTSPLAIILDGFSTPALLYGPLGRTIWEHGFNTMMVSLPGHGHSDLPPSRYRGYVEQADIVYEAITQARQRHKLEGVVYVLGHSHGGGMAQALATVAGDEISRYYLLAGVGGPEWTRVAQSLKNGLVDLKRGRILSDNVAESWWRVSGFISDGYIIIPPPWELAGWRAELIRPFTRGLHGASLRHLYSVLVDTLLDDASQLEDCLAVMGRLEARTIILAGKADGVITHEVIRTQAEAAAKPGQSSAPVFYSQTTHAGFLAPSGRKYVATMVTMADAALAEASSRHLAA